MISSTQHDYWNRVAWEKEFTHPLDLALLNQHLSINSNILDYGCGYGRVIAELEGDGFRSVLGVDTSSELVRRAESTLGGEKAQHINSVRAPFENASFDCVVLFAVLTCVPNTAHQMTLIKEIHRLLKPGGLLYISDYLLQTDKFNEGTYNENGVFILSEGAVFRHHTLEYLKELFTDFKWITTKQVPVKTLLGSDAEAIQLLLKK